MRREHWRTSATKRKLRNRLPTFREPREGEWAHLLWTSSGKTYLNGRRWLKLPWRSRSIR
jgi:hypothetical protein